jgi:UDP-N-acetylmuramoyl-L-alanyl-D-glutamate--2,6-diaminopimelate ligase
MSVAALARAAGGLLHGEDVAVTGIAVDSRAVREGYLFVAMSGRRADGGAFAADARRRGAAALCATGPAESMPTIVVPDPRAALPHLAAAFYGHPARAMRLIGVTGTLGKTSTALLVQAALAGTDGEVGVIGSLGVRVAGRVVETGMTTPEAPAIHAALREMLDVGVRTAVVEVSSHGILLERVGGLTFALGLFTNLVGDEHLEFHPTPEHYLRTKARFLDMLEPDAPLVVNGDDERVRETTRRLAPARVVRVSASGAADAEVVVAAARVSARGSELVVRVVRELPGLVGPVAPCEIPLVLPVLGVQQVENTALAVAAALIVGATPAAVAAAVATVPPIRRRMEVVRAARPLVIDDTSGNPRTLRAVFDTVRPIPRSGLRVVFGIRGARGLAINERLASTLGALVRETPARLVVTASEDAAGPRDRVTAEERDGFLRALGSAGAPFTYEPTAAAAVAAALDGVAPDEVVLLLGAQGMDRSAEIARRLLDPTGTTA